MPKRVDPRSDVYSLGIVLYEMLAGSTPFERYTGLSVISAQLSVPAPPIAELRGDLPRGLTLMLEKTLAKSPSERFQSYREWREAIADYSGTDSIAWLSRVEQAADTVAGAVSGADLAMDPTETALNGPRTRATQSDLATARRTGNAGLSSGPEPTEREAAATVITSPGRGSTPPASREPRPEGDRRYRPGLRTALALLAAFAALAALAAAYRGGAGRDPAASESPAARDASAGNAPEPFAQVTVSPTAPASVPSLSPAPSAEAEATVQPPPATASPSVPEPKPEQVPKRPPEKTKQEAKDSRRTKPKPIADIEKAFKKVGKLFK